MFINKFIQRVDNFSARNEREGMRPKVASTAKIEPRADSHFKLVKNLTISAGTSIPVAFIKPL